ncbi:succinate dehydrogenase assembly factor 2 [Altererythrobacter salegens]|uniref:FAD assembly factor SdhE n=1 Tax=Croceibacterium salegens TaxID=1737568 RepID=A0A6I4SZQ9_9SPHN|nr:succinate dehydrogenase assembly factor 2 [Croceibacterium salegens]MXO61353.1 succinate dehydrogenase assembly factor 2 [Croceibacterium salegens]
MADEFRTRLARAKFRAWHRGTREADFTIGGFYDRYHAEWGEAELTWFEHLLEEDDVKILAWAMGSADAPSKYDGEQLTALKKLDFVSI